MTYTSDLISTHSSDRRVGKRRCIKAQLLHHSLAKTQSVTATYIPEHSEKKLFRELLTWPFAKNYNFLMSSKITCNTYFK